MTRPIRVLHVATRHRNGGAERNVLHSVRRELARGYEVDVVVGADGYVPSFPEEARVYVTENLQRSVSPRTDGAIVRRLRSLIAERGYDVVHTHQSKAGIVGRVAAWRQAPVIVHTLHMSSFGDAYPRVASRAFLEAERRCAQFTTRIVSVGAELRERYLAAGVGTPEQYRVIRSPIEIDRFAALREADEAQRAAWREEQRIAESDRVVLGLGALDPRKRYDLIIREVAPLLRAGGTTLVVAGTGPEREALPALAADLGVAERVRFTGHVADVRPLLGIADVLVHAAEAEGVSQSMVQAAAAGVPVVASQVEGLKEIPGTPAVSVGPSGDGLGDAVGRLLGNGGVPVADLAELRQWAPSEVDRALDRHWDELEPLLPGH